MNFDIFKKKIDKIRKNTPELIDTYEMCNGILDDDICDIYGIFNNMCKIKQNLDPVNVVQKALYKAINDDTSIVSVMSDMFTEMSMPGGSKSALQQYFNEISRVYDKNNNDYNIVYCPENRDKLIEMNLKTVVSIAKGYQGLGLSLEELISAGNLGLVTSFDKYDPNRAKLKDDMLESIEDLDDDSSNMEILTHIQQYLTYGDIKRKFEKSFGICVQHDVVRWKDFTKADVIKWIKKNIRNATFNSVAFMWIRAYILIEIDNNSRLVKKPKSEIYNDKVKHGAYQKEITLDIDAPINTDNDTCYGDILVLEDDTPSELDVNDAYSAYKKGLNLLLDGVKPRDRSVFLKKFGIGLPRPMLPKEIAEQENLSIARISQIFQNVIEQMQKNQVKYNINIDMLFDAAKKLS